MISCFCGYLIDYTFLKIVALARSAKFLKDLYKKESQGCIFSMTDRLTIFEFYDALSLLANS